MNYYIHRVPNRVRIRSPLLKDNPTAAKEIAVMMSGVAGVSNFETNVITGSATIKFSSEKISASDLLEKIAREGYIPSLDWHDASFPERGSVTVSFTSGFSIRHLFGKVARTAAKQYLLGIFSILV